MDLTNGTVTPNVADKITNEDEKKNDSPFMESDLPTTDDALRVLEQMDNEGKEESAQAADQAPAEEKKPDPLSEKFAQLSALETKHQREKKELKDRIAELEGKTEGRLTREELIEKIKEDYKKNPRAFLEKELGGSYEELSDFILNEDDRVKEYESNSVINELQEKIKALEEREQEKEKSKKTKALEAKEQEFVGNIANHIGSKAEEYELINELGEADTVYETMKAHYDEHGTMLDIDEACKKVEDYYIEQVKKVSHLKKIKNLFQLDNKSEESVIDFSDHMENSNDQGDYNTLSNSSTTSYSEADLDNMSEHERLQLAIAQLA